MEDLTPEITKKFSSSPLQVKMLDFGSDAQVEDESIFCRETPVVEPNTSVVTRSEEIERILHVQQLNPEKSSESGDKIQTFNPIDTYEVDPKPEHSSHMVQQEISIPLLDDGITITLSATGELHQLVDLKLLVLHASLREVQHKSEEFNYPDVDQTKNGYLFLVKNKITDQDFDRESITMGNSPSSADHLRYQLNGALPPEFLIYKSCGDLPTTNEWRQACVLSLRETDLVSLPDCPDSPNLVVFFLQANNHLSDIPPSFFDHIRGLCFLDLSGIKSRTLPSSIFTLTNLQVLLLKHCVRLNNIPTEVEKLHRIELLDLSGTELHSIPNQLGKLTCLKDLQISLYGPDSGRGYVHLPSELIPRGTLPKLRKLEALTVIVHPEDHRWRKTAGEITKEIIELKGLIHLQFYFPEMDNLQNFVQTSTSWGRLTTFKFVVGHDNKRIAPRVPQRIESTYDQMARGLRFVNGDDFPEVIQQILKHATAFYLDHHVQARSLSQIGISNLNELKFCVVSECSNIEVIVDHEEKSEAILPKLEYLEIHFLWKLQSIWKSAYMPAGSFCALKRITVYTCPELQFIFPVTMLICLSNLEELVVEDCESLMKIIEGDMENVTMLPGLRKLQLSYLPRLVSLGNGLCLAEEQIIVNGCPNLKLGAKKGKSWAPLCGCF